MHFGQPKLKLIVVFLLALTVFGCKHTETFTLSFKSPDQGQTVKIGDVIDVHVDVPAGVALKSITYLVDDQLISKAQNANPIKLPTADLKLGYRLITAIVSYDEHVDTLLTNIVLKSDIKPAAISYKIVNTFPHDTSAYTQGLSYEGGKLLESTGKEGFSSIRWVNLNTGKVLQQTKLQDQYFGEGSLKIGNKIIMLTWQDNIGLVFDAQSLKQIGTFPYQNSREGWGLAFDGEHILKSDGSNRVWFLNKDTYKEERYIEVYDNTGQVDSLNEMEYIDGKIYANVYLSSKIVVIDPLTGKVEATIDLSALVPKNFFKTYDDEQNNVLNGIAWDAAGKRLFVTGKKWPNLYQIKLDR